MNSSKDSQARLFIYMFCDVRSAVTGLFSTVRISRYQSLWQHYKIWQLFKKSPNHTNTHEL